MEMVTHSYVEKLSVIVLSVLFLNDQNKNKITIVHVFFYVSWEYQHVCTYKFIIN